MNDDLTEKIIGAAIEVHRVLGSGLLESVYEGALCHELFLRGVDFKRQVDVTVRDSLNKPVTPAKAGVQRLDSPGFRLSPE